MFGVPHAAKEWREFLERRREGDEGFEAAGRAAVVSGIALIVVVAAALYVAIGAYQARDYNYGIPSAAALVVACTTHPLLGLAILVCSGALENV